jgi:hypothetical protein
MERIYINIIIVCCNKIIQVSIKLKISFLNNRPCLKIYTDVYLWMIITQLYTYLFIFTLNKCGW